MKKRSQRRIRTKTTPTVDLTGGEVKRRGRPRKAVVNKPIEAPKKGNKRGRKKKALVKEDLTKKKDNQGANECYLCSKKIKGDANTFNKHIEECMINHYEALLQAQAQAQEDDFQIFNDTYEEYTWAGQTRVRASTFLEGALGGGSFTTVKKSVDIDDDLDIDMVEEVQYGEAQFTEEDLNKIAKKGKKSKSDNENEATVTYEDTIDEPKTNEKEAEQKIKPGNVQNRLNSQKMIIESLKQKIYSLQNQSQQTNNNVSCLICQDSYQIPLVSTGCWHVHCETCWLQSLAVKKLCPQCQRITFPSELRRIYL
ncbi:hypothetical protein K502DRAFT_340952 [Neoconidiobolus thromboides FSU 785]|nr:hypothetical protein K502DRAFT_340952 [Neoconidiobolus thromboides FSU 785]